MPVERSEAVAKLPKAAGPSARKRMVGMVVAAAVLAYAGRAGYVSHFYEETDDAQIDADVATVSPRISGTVKTVLVEENQVVAAGQLLATLDTAELEVALAQARAYVLQAEAQLKAEDPSVAMAETSNGASIATTSSDVGGAAAEFASASALRKRRLAQLAQAEAASKLAAVELERSEHLSSTGATAATDLDGRRASFDAARAARDAAARDVEVTEQMLHQMRFRVAAATSRREEARQNAPRNLEVKKALLEVRRTTVDVAKAQLAQASLNLEHARIVSPIAGIVGRKSITIGDHVQQGQPLLAVTPVDRVWVTANFRETQLRAMHPDQRATLHVDALDLDLHGVVESMPGATGARYSLLPPENASGNYVKVVQRMPVRIRIDDGQPGADRLRPGMSVEPVVRVR